MLSANGQFDLAIIGGGPAGTSAAVTAARLGASIVLFEAREFPRHKVCGEFISAEALDVLADLLQDSARAQPPLVSGPVVCRARLLFGDRVIEANVSPEALSISRYDLDAQLWRAAQAAGVATHDSCEVAAVEGSGPFQLQTSLGRFAARAVIVAAGRWSQFTPDRAVPAGPKWIGLKAHFREPNPAVSTDLYFFDGGYCGVQPVAKDVVNACSMVRADRATSLPEVFRLHPALTERAAGWTPLTQTISTAPLIYRRQRPVRDNMVFTGDAAAFIDPFVGDGISIALRSGQVAAQSLSQFLTGEGTLLAALEAYQCEYSRQFSPLLWAAARARRLLSLPLLAQIAVFEMLRLPGLIPFIIRKTRRAT